MTDLKEKVFYIYNKQKIDRASITIIKTTNFPDGYSKLNDLHNQIRSNNKQKIKSSNFPNYMDNIDDDNNKKIEDIQPSKSNQLLNKEKINLPLNPNSKSVNIKKGEFCVNESKNVLQLNEQKKTISIEKINGDPKLNNNNQQMSTSIYSNKKFKEIKKKMINLWENGEENDEKPKKSTLLQVNEKVSYNKSHENKKVFGLYNEVIDKKENTGSKLKSMMKMLNHPPIQIENNTPLFESRTKTNSLSKDSKIDSRNGRQTIHEDYKSKIRMGNTFNNFLTENSKSNIFTEVKTNSINNNNFISNFERNLNTDPVELKLNEKVKKQEFVQKSQNNSSKQNIYNNSMETLINRITPRLNIDYNNLQAAIETKPKNLFQNYVTNKSEKKNQTPSLINLNNEVSKSSNSYGVNHISKLSLVKSESQSSILHDNVIKLVRQLKFASDNELTPNVINELKTLHKLIEKVIKK